jgi:hypothetical protein
VPALGGRVLPTGAVAALCATGLAWVTIQAMSGYLRSDRAEPLVAATIGGVVIAVAAAAASASHGATRATLAYSAAVILGALPIVAVAFWRARGRLLRRPKDPGERG